MKQLMRLVGQIKHLWGTYWEMLKVMNIGKSRVKQLMMIKWKLEQQMNSAGLFSDYTQQYLTNTLEDNWSVFNIKKASSLPAKWQFALDDLDGHFHGITELSQATFGGGFLPAILGTKTPGINFATHLIL